MSVPSVRYALLLLQCCSTVGPGGRYRLRKGWVSYCLFSYIRFIIVHFSVITLSREQPRRMLHGIANRRRLPTSCKDPFLGGRWESSAGKGNGLCWQAGKVVVSAYQECWEKAGCISETSQNGCGFREVNENGIFLEKLGQKPVCIAPRYILISQPPK